MTTHVEGGWCDTALGSEDGDWLEPGFWGRRALPGISLTYMRRADKASPRERIGLPVLPPISGLQKSPAEGGQSTEKKGRGDLQGLSELLNSLWSPLGHHLCSLKTVAVVYITYVLFFQRPQEAKDCKGHDCFLCH